MYSAEYCPEISLACFSITVINQNGRRVCYNFLNRRWEDAETGEPAVVRKWKYEEPKKISEYLKEFEDAAKVKL